MAISELGIGKLHEESKEDGLIFRKIGEVAGKEEVLSEIDFGPLITEQVESGFPLLHAHALVSIWTALEQFVNDCAISLMVNNPQLLSNEKLAKVKIKIGEYTQIDDYARMEYVLRMASLTSRYGIDRFEEVFKQLGASDSLDKSMRKVLLEMCETRNVLIHRAGIIDSKYLKACRWEKEYSEGDKVKITPEKFDQFYSTSKQYADIIGKRIEQITINNS